MEQYLSMLVSAFANCLDWFGDILGGSGFGGLYLGCVAVILTYKFLLAPVFGGHQSDKAS